MKITISVIKADIGSVGGHIKPSDRLLETVKDYVGEYGKGFLKDFYVSFTGDDIAILMTHTLGKGNAKIHRLAWDAFKAGTLVAKNQGLYGAGQDLLKDSFSGNVKGMGPAVAELEFKERPNEPFLFFAADKTEPGAYNLPLYLSFSDPMYCAGLLLSSGMTKGFRFTIMDVAHTKGDKVIQLNSPDDIYDIAALLRDNDRFVVESVHSRHSGDQAVSVSTTRLHNIAGKYTGKDDPVMLVRVQKDFPATGEILSPFSIGHLVGGFMRGSHTGPLMPVKLNSTISYFDGPPVVSCAAFCVHNGKLTEAVDAFDQPYWDFVRNKVSQKAYDIRRQGFSGPAMLSYSELEYGGIVEILNRLEKKFKVRK
ncbi:MAG: fructose 1,6-bisphosphatase [Candidatus Aenigmarchaeota archaeon]|nr:fructose 1,6-bisphosphatase [Candidatus Aenigmarchaeota archaeon]NIQ17747.1 fructose 1,6-bisphosphatase [Candidatus Aenigmarchaeota archaeon]NIS73067.1 fructose 1,6-bisphosphatase [Candidatus Aenigmarchaeota archaeon]